ncbi:GTP cyclohydrolase II [Arthrobacter sp. HLT1-21]
MNTANVTGGPVVTLPTAFGQFTTRAWTDEVTGVEHLSLSSPGGKGAAGAEAPLVRLHSECLTGDVFSSFRCDCGEQLEQALQLVAEQGGTVVYLRGQEGRGIGLANKMRAYALQEGGADTVEANEQLGLPVDSRDYQAAAAILHQLDLGAIRLLSNNPEKRDKLLEHGIEVTAMVPAVVPARAENQRYLQTKRDRLNHRLTQLEDHGLQQS